MGLGKYTSKIFRTRKDAEEYVRTLQKRPEEYLITKGDIERAEYLDALGEKHTYYTISSIWYEIK